MNAFSQLGKALLLILIKLLVEGSYSLMASRDMFPEGISHTTNAHDQQEAARIRDQLRAEKSSAKSHEDVNTSILPSVEICEGAHKYVQITAARNGIEQTFVVSRRNAAYHRNAAEPFIEKLRRSGYYDIEVTGGGRVAFDEDQKEISIYGYSYGFGKADHERSAEIVRQDERYKDYHVSWSDEGY